LLDGGELWIPSLVRLRGEYRESAPLDIKETAGAGLATHLEDSRTMPIFENTKEIVENQRGVRKVLDAIERVITVWAPIF
jgi:hypothetical protein